MTMMSSSVRILVVDDNPDMAADAVREISDFFRARDDLTIEVSSETSFDAGYRKIANGECDLVILDVRRDEQEGIEEDDDAGRRVIEDFAKLRFMPVIFWTALPDHVSDKVMPPLVTVLGKDDLEIIPSHILTILATNVIAVLRDVEENVSRVMREHMWSELAPNWEEDTAGGQPDELAHILVTRVAQGLQDRDLPELTIRPSHCYLYPPVSSRLRPGDILRSKAGKWFTILTPACDLAHDGKADFVLLAQAKSVQEFDKFIQWDATGGSGKWESLARVLQGSQARYHFLPKFRNIPHMIIDLENVTSVPVATMIDYERVSSLVSPYAEALLVKHSHFRGRVGTPDLNMTVVRAALELLRSP